MKSAVVIGASGGIGGALADALAEEGVAVRRYARSLTGTQHLDLLDEATIAAAAATMGSPDLVIVATGVLYDGEAGPEKALRDLDAAWLARQFAVNAIGPALVAKHVLPIMPRMGRTVFAVLSARVGSIPTIASADGTAIARRKPRSTSSSARSRSRSAAATIAASSSLSTPAPSRPRSRRRSGKQAATCSPPIAPRYSSST